MLVIKYLCKGLNVIGACVVGYALIDTAYKIGYERGKEENETSDKNVEKRTLSAFINNIHTGETHTFFKKDGSVLKIKVL